MKYRITIIITFFVFGLIQSAIANDELYVNTPAYKKRIITIEDKLIEKINFQGTAYYYPLNNDNDIHFSLSESGWCYPTLTLKFNTKVDYYDIEADNKVYIHHSGATEILTGSLGVYYPTDKPEFQDVIIETGVESCLAEHRISPKVDLIEKVKHALYSNSDIHFRVEIVEKSSNRNIYFTMSPAEIIAGKTIIQVWEYIVNRKRMFENSESK